MFLRNMVLGLGSPATLFCHARACRKTDYLGHKFKDLFMQGLLEAPSTAGFLPVCTGVAAAAGYMLSSSEAGDKPGLCTLTDLP